MLHPNSESYLPRLAYETHIHLKNNLLAPPSDSLGSTGHPDYPVVETEESGNQGLFQSSGSEPDPSIRESLLRILERLRDIERNALGQDVIMLPAIEKIEAQLGIRK